MFPASLRIPAFRRLLAASTLSVTGSLMTFVVLPIVAYEETGSSSTFAFIMAAGGVGMLVALPFGGVFADRYDRRHLLLCGNAASVLVMLVMFLAVATETWWSLPLVEFFATLLGSLFASAGPALRRDALTDDVRTQGTALFSAGMSAANLLGPLLGGAIFAFAGFGVVILVDILTFVASFVLIFGLRMETRARPTQEDVVVGVRSLLRRTGRDIASGLQVARIDPFLRRFITATMVSGIGNGFLLVAAVPWMDESLGLSTNLWGAAIAIMGAAGLLSALIVARIGERLSPTTLITTGSVLFAGGALLLAGAPSAVRLMVAFALVGACNSTIGVGIGTVQQRRVASSHQGRISSVHFASFQLAQLAATLTAGLTIERIGPANGITVAIAGFLATSLLFFWTGRASLVPTPAFSEEELALSA